MSLARDTADYGHIKTARKNLIINGTCQLAQRGTSFAAAASGTFPVDRFEFSRSSSTGVFTVSQGNIADTAAVNFTDYILVDVTTADTSVAAGEYLQVLQKLEGWDTGHLAWGSSAAQAVTLSFTHAHTKTGTYCVSVRNAADDRHYVAEYTQSVSNEWEETVITIPGDTSGTWDRGGLVGLYISFVGLCGTTYGAATADTWGAGNMIATSNQVNCADTVSNRLRFTQIQLEAGNEATDFERRHFSEELALCQRYYQKLYFVNYRPFGVGRTGGSGSLLGATQTLMTEMRAAPTVSNTNNGMSRSRTSDLAGTAITAATDFFVASGTRQIHLDIASEGTTNETYTMMFQSDTGVYCDAEL